MFVRICIVFYYWATILSTVVGDDNEADYYGNRDLPSGNGTMDCNSEVVKNICTLKCGENHACFLGKCFCLKPATEQNKELKLHKQVDYPMKPVLRHHIAHFCPNLEEARNCIRKCMEMGKPAFCGKDHVCYCGHNYGNPSNKKENPEEMYNQFQDLYEKYFGSKGGSD